MAQFAPNGQPRADVITGAHAVLFSRDADGLRAFLRDVLGLDGVDAGGGWLIFALPPAEVAAHPSETGGSHQLYLMCDDIEATVAELSAKGVEFTGPVAGRRLGPADRDEGPRRRRARPLRAAPPEPASLSARAGASELLTSRRLRRRHRAARAGCASHAIDGVGLNAALSSSSPQSAGRGRLRQLRALRRSSSAGRRSTPFARLRRATGRSPRFATLASRRDRIVRRTACQGADRPRAVRSLARNDAQRHARSLVGAGPARPAAASWAAAAGRRRRSRSHADGRDGSHRRLPRRRRDHPVSARARRVADAAARRVWQGARRPRQVVRAQPRGRNAYVAVDRSVVVLDRSPAAASSCARGATRAAISGARAARSCAACSGRAGSR